MSNFTKEPILRIRQHAYWPYCRHDRAKLARDIFRYRSGITSIRVWPRHYGDRL